MTRNVDLRCVLERDKVPAPLIIVPESLISELAFWSGFDIGKCRYVEKG